MVASVNTVRNVLEAVRRHVDEKTLEDILFDLLDVKGNKSFEDTIRLLLTEHINRRNNVQTL